MARLVKFEVFGQEYPLYTDAPEEDVREILALVKKHLEETSPATNVIPSGKSVILATLNMAGRYVKLKRDFEAYRNKIDSLGLNIIKKIEEFD
ncbi:MAG: cell division protein ZapA [Proteobacteria bacterium]|nr:cell division protein ZapA [Pseudomonadota bacterium]MBU1686686.1 cell division protein ZapA [Pseudomonadota bacterium]